MLEPAHFLAPAQARIAGYEVGSAVPEVQAHIEELEADAGDQDGGDRYQGQQGARWQPAANDGAFVLAKQLFDPPQRDWIDVPGVSGNIVHLLDAAIVGRMEAVIHAGSQPQS